MPLGWGIRVTIEDFEGKPLAEYGTSYLGAGPNKRSRIVATKIEATTDLKIRFRVQGVGPYLDFTEKDRRMKAGLSTSGLTITPSLFKSPPYDLLIEIYVDGKLSYNDDVISFTPDSEALALGAVIQDCEMPSRVNDASEQLYTVHNWRFTEVGIDLRLGQLTLSSDRTDASDGETDQVQAVGASQNEDEHNGGNAGTIEVHLHRFVKEPEPRNFVYSQAPEVYVAANDISAETVALETGRPYSNEADSQITHKVELVSGAREAPEPTYVEGYSPDESGYPYGKYRFQYMSLSKLVAMDLANEDRSEVTARQKRARNRQQTLRAPPSSLAKMTKRKVSGETEASPETVSPIEPSKRTKSDAVESAPEQQMVMPIRTKADSQRRWLRSSAKEEGQPSPNDTEDGKSVDSRMSKTRPEPEYDDEDSGRSAEMTGHLEGRQSRFRGVVVVQGATTLSEQG